MDKSDVENIGVFMKKTVSFLLCLVLLCVMAFPAPVCATMQEPNIDTSSVQPSDSLSGSYSFDADSAMLGNQEITTNAKAIFLFELHTQTMMYSLNPDTPMDPSSLTKLMTALIALESGGLDDLVEVNQRTLDTVPDDAVSADLVDGELISLRDLVYCLLVGSANDAAAVIAEHIAGNQTTFVKMMNARAEEIGCDGTNYTNVHGIYSSSQTMSARDVAKVLGVAMQNPDFCTIFTSSHYSVPATNKSAERRLTTSNHLAHTDEMEIYYDARVTGGRTGTAGNGSKCLAVTAEDHGMHLISVLMGAESVMEEGGNRIQSYAEFAVTKTLLDAGFNGYKVAQLFYEGQAMTTCTVANGENPVVIGPNAAVSSVLPFDADSSNLDYRYDYSTNSLQAPIAKGDHICTVEIWFQNLCVGKSELYAMNDVRVTGHLNQLAPTPKNNAHIWLWVLLGICIVITVIFVYSRIRTKMILRAYDHSARRHRRDRRKDK